MGGMNENIEKRQGGALAGIGGKAVAVVVLLVAAWVLFKIVIGVVAAVAWTIVAVLAVVAVLWALNKLL
ncbi:MAG: hypothetical protein QOH76_2410 [Thermoleophilaceae bacterium]|jgi:hypothetical protein|nr:hypothetical protein [Thermoleophilaceae bacterium]